MLRFIVPALCLMILAFNAVADQAQRIRPAAVAGSWYPGDPAQLGAYLDRLLLDEGAGRNDPSRARIRALISPHAGYRYSGAVAADAYRLLRGQAVKRVVLLGPAHHGEFRGLSIADVTHYQTPLGRIPLDLQAVERLRASALVSADPAAHRNEHSLEMQLPFLQRVLQPGWQLLPLLVGQMQARDYSRTAELLRPMLDDDTLVVVSSDFTHYGQGFNYRPFTLDADIPARLEALDRGSLNYIRNRDPQGFLDYRRRTGTTICGYRPIALLLQMLPSDSQAELISYDTSGNLTGDYARSVSYMSIIFRTADDALSQHQPAPGLLSPQAMRLLHQLASSAVTTVARPQDVTAWQRLQQLQQRLTPELSLPAGAFVTLWHGDRLRGCIGSKQANRPLYQTVIANGIHSALNDRRFPPLQANELAGLDVEISVMTPPKTIASHEDFIFGEQGIMIEMDGRSAIYLPGAAHKYGWNRHQLLQRLARKAGLPDDAWQNGASLKTFRTQSYRAPFGVTGR